MNKSCPTQRALDRRDSHRQMELIPCSNKFRQIRFIPSHPLAVAGEPIADLMLSHRNRGAINRALFKLDKRVEKPNKAMNDEVLGRRLWDELVVLTGLTTAGEKERAYNSLELTRDPAAEARDDWIANC